MHALIVDDDEVVVQFFKICLTRLGYQVTTAGDGMAALDLCKAQPFDVVLCDVRMPRLNGISFIRNVKRMAPGSTNRIIVISSMDDRTVRNDALAAGAESFLLKPVTAAALAGALGVPSIPAAPGAPPS
jgi:CheY-like chemotaxis protein